MQYRDRNVVGVGIGGDEVRGPAEWFEREYAYAKDHGLHLTVHAGESAGPESIAAAVNLLHAERIGHGLTAIQDPRIVDLLAERQVAVEICLSSNLRTGCCKKIEEHPLKRYFDAGVLVTLNTDDPEMFETTLNREYQIAQEAFGFTTRNSRNWRGIRLRRRSCRRNGAPVVCRPSGACRTLNSLPRPHGLGLRMTPLRSSPDELRIPDCCLALVN